MNRFRKISIRILSWFFIRGIRLLMSGYGAHYTLLDKIHAKPNVPTCLGFVRLAKAWFSGRVSLTLVQIRCVNLTLLDKIHANPGMSTCVALSS